MGPYEILETFSKIFVLTICTWNEGQKLFFITSFIIYLTNRFHFAVSLYSDNAQMTSKRGENKEVRYEPQASIVADVLTTF